MAAMSRGGMCRIDVASRFWVFAASSRFFRTLPQKRGGVLGKDRVQRVADGRVRRRRKLSRVTVPPNERVSIQQQVHDYPVQNSSGSGASKSSVVSIAPGCRPATRGSTSGTRRARGVGAIGQDHTRPDYGNGEGFAKARRQLTDIDRRGHRPPI